MANEATGSRPCIIIAPLKGGSGPVIRIDLFVDDRRPSILVGAPFIWILLISTSNNNNC